MASPGEAKVVRTVPADDLARGEPVQLPQLLPELLARRVRIDPEVVAVGLLKDFLHPRRWRIGILIAVQLDVFLGGVRLKSRHVTFHRRNLGPNVFHGQSLSVPIKAE